MVKSVPGITSSRRPSASRPPHGGFSFVEILFAVMILGIGFILIAGIFPVAINQTQANGDETIAASTARQAAAVIASMPNTSALMAADGNVHRFGPSATPTTAPFGDPDLALWNELNGSQVLTEDPRYAWVPFYCRNTDANNLPNDFAQITVIAVRARNHAAYVPSKNSGGDEYVTGTNAAAKATLIGTKVDNVTLNASTSLAIPDTITFPPVAVAGAAAPGAFVIIAFDNFAANAAIAAAKATPPVPYSGSAVGWVLKIGDPTGTPGTFNLQPGGDIKNQSASVYRPPAGDTFSVFIVGQGADPDNAATFSGGAQDVMAYTTMIPLH